MASSRAALSIRWCCRMLAGAGQSVGVSPLRRSQSDIFGRYGRRWPGARPRACHLCDSALSRMTVQAQLWHAASTISCGQQFWQRQLRAGWPTIRRRIDDEPDCARGPAVQGDNRRGGGGDDCARRHRWPQRLYRLGLSQGCATGAGRADRGRARRRQPVPHPRVDRRLHRPRTGRGTGPRQGYRIPPAV